MRYLLGYAMATNLFGGGPVPRIYERSAIQIFVENSTKVMFLQPLRFNFFGEWHAAEDGFS